MTDLSNYYQRDPRNSESTPLERFPKNHVKFSESLKPISDSPAEMMMDEMLKEFDSAAPLDKYLGTEEELKQLRKLVALFCEGFDNNPFISIIGRYIRKVMVLDNLKNRKKVLQYYHSNKEFLETNGKFEAPVIITGFGRSGTTLLHRIMSEDPNTRSPYLFEMEMPIPPMTSEDNPLKDPRIKSREAATNITSRIMPGFLEKLAESHHTSPTEKEESFSYMLGHNGFSILVGLMAGRAFLDNFFKIEIMRPIFRYERLFFTMLDAYRPAKSHWTLKTPLYAYYFPLILEEYPDARVVLTHRNPLITLPSACRLLESTCIPFDQDGSFDKHRFGQFIQEVTKSVLMVPFNYRKEHPEKEEQIFDCMYEELFSDPIAMVKRIYQKFDLEYTEEFEERIRAYLENNKQGKYGQHKYSLEEYGFNAERLYQENKNYMEHYGFGIPDKIERPVSFDFGLGSDQAETPVTG
ncbi:MAG: sulfotransferase [Calditrichaeota bacterium]|nr:sulfotransferase [Calditrichota bacterium]